MPAFSLTIAVILGASLGSAPAAKQIQSGPQPGGKIPGSFNAFVAQCPGKPEYVGKKFDFVGELYKTAPVIMVFMREADETLGALLKAVDTAASKNKTFALFVLLADDEDAGVRVLRTLAERCEIKHTSSAVDSVTGPPAYKIAKDANVTAVLFKNYSIRDNFAFKKGELNDKSIEKITAAIRRLDKD